MLLRGVPDYYAVCLSALLAKICKCCTTAHGVSLLKRDSRSAVRGPDRLPDDRQRKPDPWVGFGGAIAVGSGERPGNHAPAEPGRTGQ